jgi:hypothetical protein
MRYFGCVAIMLPSESPGGSIMPLRFMLLLTVLVSATSSAMAYTPSAGKLKEGEVAYVDDGTCPKGKVDKVTGGNHKLGVGRKHACVVHP